MADISVANNYQLKEIEREGSNFQKPRRIFKNRQPTRRQIGPSTINTMIARYIFSYVKTCVNAYFQYFENCENLKTEIFQPENFQKVKTEIVSKTPTMYANM